jgi:hypothetical protein
MAETSDEPDELVSRGKTGLQVRKRRRDGWSARKRETFLNHLRVTSNAAASARAAGMTEGSAHKLRARDPEFADQWEAALRQADVRLTGKLIVLAETGGKPLPEREDGEPAEAPIEDFNADLALKVLALNRQSQTGKRRGGPRPKSASPEELLEAGVKLLGLMKRRRSVRRGA